MTGKSSVLFLAWRGPGHPEAGGSEVYVHEISRELIAQGHHVTLRTSRPPGARRREVVDGVHIDRRGGRLGVYLWGLAHLLWGPGRRADIVVDVINGVPFAAPLVRRQGVIGLVHHVHRQQWHLIYPGAAGRLGWFVESHLVPMLYRRLPVITVSEATKADLVALGLAPEFVTVVRNGLTTRPSEALRSATPRMVVLARLVPHKQIEHVLDAVAATRGQHPELTLDVIGDGWWRGVLEEHASRLGLDDRVTFHGHVDDARRDDLLAGAWLQVLPSAKEGWGIAVTEAAAQGTPTMGYRTSGGLGESITDGVTGWLVDDHAELVTRVGEVLASPEELRKRGRAARRAALQLDWSASGRAFATVWRSDSAVAVGDDLLVGRVGRRSAGLGGDETEQRGRGEDDADDGRDDDVRDH
jgi:glycosyltransferase involved in cell wall biosynthesis